MIAVRVVFYPADIIFLQSFADRYGRFSFFQLLGKAGRVNKKQKINIGHAQIGFQKRVDDERHRFIRERSEPRASYSAEKQCGFPCELYQNADGEKVWDIDPFAFPIV